MGIFPSICVIAPKDENATHYTRAENNFPSHDCRPSSKTHREFEPGGKGSLYKVAQ